jgi:hypothetical protein
MYKFFFVAPFLHFSSILKNKEDSSSVLGPSSPVDVNPVFTYLSELITILIY